MLKRVGISLATSSIEMILQVAAIGFAVLVIVQLMTLWGTRWGDRNSLIKSLLLSVLVHICIVLEWNVVSPRGVETASAEPTRTAAEPVRIVFLPEVVPEQTSQSGSGPFPGFPQPSARPSGQLSLVPEQVLAEPTAPSIDRTPRPRMSSTADVPRLLAEIEEPQLLPELEKPAAALQKNAPVKAPALSEIDAAVEAAPQSEQRPLQRLRKPATQTADPLVSPDSIAARTVNRRRAAIPDESSSGQEEFKFPDGPSSAPTPEVAMRPSSPPAGVRNGDPTEPPRTKVRPVAPYPKPQRIVHGVVKDAETGRLLAGVTVRIDQLQGGPLSGVTTKDGTYEIPFNEVPDNTAVTASLPGYLPVSKNLVGSDRRQMSSRLNFTMSSSNDSVIAVEEQPVVHHLGDDRFEGQINSQFQRKAEGTSIVLKFKLSSNFRQPKPIRANVTFMAKGVQCSPKVSVNGKLLVPVSEKSASDGSFSPMQFAIDPNSLRVGENQFEMIAVKCLDLSDLDDFEFVNVQIRLSRTE